MKIGLLLIALGFGYKIYAEASVNPKKRLKKLGQIVGISMMVLSFVGSICVAACFVTSAKYCPMTGKKLGGSKLFCPITGQVVPQQ